MFLLFIKAEEGPALSPGLNTVRSDVILLETVPYLYTIVKLALLNS